jgi:hypothetical protein
MCVPVSKSSHRNLETRNADAVSGVERHEHIGRVRVSPVTAVTVVCAKVLKMGR